MYLFYYLNFAIFERLKHEPRYFLKVDTFGISNIYYKFVKQSLPFLTQSGTETKVYLMVEYIAKVVGVKLSYRSVPDLFNLDMRSARYRRSVTITYNRSLKCPLLTIRTRLVL